MFSVSLIQGNKEKVHFSVTETGLVRYCWLFFETMKNNIESFFNIVWEMNKKYFGIDLHNNITYINKTGFRITKIWIPNLMLSLSIVWIFCPNSSFNNWNGTNQHSSRRVWLTFANIFVFSKEEEKSYKQKRHEPCQVIWPEQTKCSWWDRI